AFLTGDEVRAAFEAAIAEREAAGHVLDNRLVAIERAAIEDARLTGKVAEIEVRFDAFVAAVTRDKDGELVAGSMSDAVPTKDIWTFQRNLASKDPNWLLVETDDAA
ncbi:MAG: Tim44/TimA family putative adaptor protein, partial [Allosphingosinicella sp.]